MAASTEESEYHDPPQGIIEISIEDILLVYF